MEDRKYLISGLASSGSLFFTPFTRDTYFPFYPPPPGGGGCNFYKLGENMMKEKREKKEKKDTKRRQKGEKRQKKTIRGRMTKSDT